MQFITSVLDFILNNKLASSLVSALLIGVVTWGYKSYSDTKARKRIYAFLLSSSKDSKWQFRSTHAIASNTKLTEARVETLCTQDSRIRRSEKEKQAWQLID
jgi:hypothetical protein